MSWMSESANSINSRLFGPHVESFLMSVWFMVIRFQKSLFSTQLSSLVSGLGLKVHFQQENNDSSANQTICHAVNEITSRYKWIHLLWILSHFLCPETFNYQITAEAGTTNVRVFENFDLHVDFLRPSNLFYRISFFYGLLETGACL